MLEIYVRYSLLFYTFVLNGWYFATYGVLIPYYSLETGLDQTYFSFTFLTRSIAFISSALLIKKLILHYTTHSIITFSLAFVVVSLFLCSLSVSSLNLSVMLFVSGFCYNIINILTFSIICQLFKGQRPEFWILLIQVGFGVGATLASLLVKLFGLATYKVLSILYLIPLLFYCKYKIENLEEQSWQKKQKTISRKTQLCICFMMLVFPALETGFVGWIPTYSIKAGAAAPQDSSNYSIIFWIANSAFRIVWVMLPYSVTNKLKTANAAFLLFSCFFIFVQYAKFYGFLCIFSSFTFGLLTSSMYSFFITLPLDNGFVLTTGNNANFLLANCIGEALLPAPIGYSMNIFGFQSLFIIIFIVCVINDGAFMFTMTSMSEGEPATGAQAKANQGQLALLSPL